VKARARHLAVALVLLASCSAPSSGDVYTLVRSSAADQLNPSPSEASLRIHVATFDASEGAKYNAENCEIARRLFEEQPRVSVRYWCEKGRFHP
jgi:hypothetical protein